MYLLKILQEIESNYCGFDITSKKKRNRLLNSMSISFHESKRATYAWKSVCRKIYLKPASSALKEIRDGIGSELFVALSMRPTRLSMSRAILAFHLLQRCYYFLQCWVLILSFLPSHFGNRNRVSRCLRKW